VAFHHSLDEAYARAYGRTSRLYEAERRFTAWLDVRAVPYVDFSGSADNLMRHYESSDVHMGYHVHTPIFMTSVRRPSLLLAEAAASACSVRCWVGTSPTRSTACAAGASGAPSGAWASVAVASASRRDSLPTSSTS
jgi:hypothetical protein